MTVPENPETNLPDRPSLKQPVILLVDDEEMIRILMTPMLEEHGYVALSASDGQEALEISRKHPGTIDLVITDLKLPRLNGSDLRRVFANLQLPALVQAI